MFEKLARYFARKKAERRRLDEWQAFLREDCDWDYAFILRMLAYKLERMRKCILKNGIIADAQQVANEIKEVEDLIRRVDDDNYFEEMTEEFRKKHGELEMYIADDGVVSFWFTNETQEASDALRDEWHSYHALASDAREADLRKAFDLMATRIWGWWD